MIKLEQQENGLLITLTDKTEYSELYMSNNGYPSVADLLEESRYLGNGWFDCTDMVGTTNSPIFGYDCMFNEETDELIDGDFYWFPDYMVINPFKVLYDEGSVFFEKG